MTAFIPPCRPRPVKTPPASDAWLHEPKLDGWRLQAVKYGRDVTLYSRNGNDLTERFPSIADAVRSLDTKSATIDGELTASTEAGMNFYAIPSRRAGLTLWAFDLLERDGKDLRSLPLIERKRRLARLMSSAGDGLQLVTTFDDGQALFAACMQHKLEGVVSKLRNAPYRSGPRSDWLKSKCPAWRAAHRERWRIFEKRGSSRG